MSTNSIRIRCNGCDYEYLEHFQPITLKCRIGDEVAKYHRTTAWCNQCDTIRYVECIPTVDEIREEYDEFVAPYVEPPPTGIRKFIDKFMKGIFSSNRDNRHDESIRELNSKIAWRQARTALPHCLTCGTTNLTSVDFKSAHDGQSVSTNFHHSCGGQLVIDRNDAPDLRIHFRNKVLWMDIDGNKVEDG